VFNQTAQPSCGVCHTLSEAGSAGTVGPDLDMLAPTEEQVANAVKNGVGIMPSFGSTLTPEQITDVARYVLEATR